MLAHSLGLAEPGEPVTAAQLLPRFDAARLPREPWVVR
jgi:glutamyl-tRNA synthetase